MTGHELARLLLAHGDNDVRFLVAINDGVSDAPYDMHLAGDPSEFAELDEAYGPGDMVRYDPKSDVIVIRAGVIYTGKSEYE